MPPEGGSRCPSEAPKPPREVRGFPTFPGRDPATTANAVGGRSGGHVLEHSPVPNTHGRPPRHGHAAPGDGTGKHLPPGAVTMPRAPWRPCSTPGCPELVQRGKCSTCTAAVDAARGTPEQRGYDKAHRSRRRQAAPQVATGTVRCWRCGELIAPGEEWDLGHDDEDRSVTRGPEHRGRCNRAAAARKGNANRMH